MNFDTGPNRRPALRVVIHESGLNHMASNIYVQDACGSYRLATTKELLATARARVNSRYRRGASLTSNEDTIDYLFPKYAEESSEVFGVIYLDARHRIIEFVPHFRGTISQCSVFPRVILKHALEVNAAAVICSHNHPSGSSEPSQADILLTREIKDLLKRIDVNLLDHFILASLDNTSMAARGLV